MTGSMTIVNAMSWMTCLMVMRSPCLINASRLAELKQRVQQSLNSVNRQDNKTTMPMSPGGSSKRGQMDSLSSEHNPYDNNLYAEQVSPLTDGGNDHQNHDELAMDDPALAAAM